MSVISSFCCTMVSWAAKVRMPQTAEPFATQCAIRAISGYHRTISKFTGRACLFHPSCSQRAIEALREYGYTRGIKLALAQLERCGGNYVLGVDTSGETWLVTSDGVRFGSHELSEDIKCGSQAVQSGGRKYWSVVDS
jgi:hypothetical protein